MRFFRCSCGCVLKGEVCICFRPKYLHLNSLRVRLRCFANQCRKAKPGNEVRAASPKEYLCRRLSCRFNRERSSTWLFPPKESRLKFPRSCSERCAIFCTAASRAVRLSSSSGTGELPAWRPWSKRFISETLGRSGDLTLSLSSESRNGNPLRRQRYGAQFYGMKHRSPYGHKSF